MKKTPVESKAVVADRTRRIRWFRDARFGLFIHYGAYAQLQRGAWTMNRERIPVPEYERLATTFRPKPGCTDEWTRLARRTGMRYAVLTTKHHDGFCLWDTKQTDFNSVQRGPHRDLVAEYVASCRRQGLKVGLYYSLMDWHHPDGVRCARDARARRRFLDFTQGCVRELMSNYGKIDVLWYDVMWPWKDPETWETAKMNAMVRELQPDILINNRAGLPEDFGTPEGHIQPEKDGRAWESCMTFNEYWAYADTPEEDWRSVRNIVGMLRQIINGNGNLLLNIGPMPDGSVPRIASERLGTLSRWIAKHHDLVYGHGDPINGLEGWAGCGMWSRRGNTGYYWIMKWPGESFGIGGLKTKVLSVRLLPEGRPVRFRQEPQRLVLTGLPKRCPDRLCNVAVLQVEFAARPRQALGEGPVMIKMPKAK